MVEIAVSNPTHIEVAAHSVTDSGLMTLAAFLLLAGIRHRRISDPRDTMPDDDVAPLGLAGWHLVDAPETGRFDSREPYFSHIAERTSVSNDELGSLIWDAFRSQRSPDLAKAVLAGTASPDGLVRFSALTSAIEMFRYSPEFTRRLIEFDSYSGRTTTAIRSIVASRLFGAALSASDPPVEVRPVQEQEPGLMLIHGTNFPPSRPIWSVPGVGPLFQHLAVIRPDVYGKPDYFRWEGGYSAYAREVAAMNLNDWIKHRALTGIDAITHSHGGNVLMASTYLEAKFGHVIFLSCPVRWNQYQVCPGTVQKKNSVRVHLDLVITADRAAQRFPIGSGIIDTVLPIWFDHGATYEPTNWTTYDLDALVKSK